MEASSYTIGNDNRKIEQQIQPKLNPIAPNFTIDRKNLFSRVSPAWDSEVSIFDGKVGNNEDFLLKPSSRPKKKQLLVTFQAGLMGLIIQGNIVTSVLQSAQAEKLGVKVGWCILAVNGKRMPTGNSKVIDTAIEETYKRKKPTTILFDTAADADVIPPSRPEHLQCSDTAYSSLPTDFRKKKMDLFSKYSPKLLSTNAAMSALALGGGDNSLSIFGDPESLGKKLKDKNIIPALARMEGHNPQAAPFIPRSAEHRDDSDVEQDLFTAFSPPWKVNGINGCNPNAPEFVPQMHDIPELHLSGHIPRIPTAYSHDSTRGMEIRKMSQIFRPPTEIEILVTFPHTELKGFKTRGNVVDWIRPNSRAYKARIRKGWRIVRINGSLQEDNTGSIEHAISESAQVNKSTDILFRKVIPHLKSPHLAEFHLNANEYQARIKVLETGDLIEYNTTKGWRNGKILSLNLNGTFQIERWNGKVGDKWQPYNIRVDLTRIPGELIYYRTISNWRPGSIISMNTDGTYEIQRREAEGVGHKWKAYNIRSRKVTS